MTNCDKYFERISCLIDGELSEEDRANTEKHLQSCPSCRSLYEVFQNISIETKDSLMEPPEELLQGVRYRMNQLENNTLDTPHVISGKTKKKKSMFVARYTALAACLALILLTVPRLGNLGCSTSTTYDASVSENGMVSECSIADGDERMTAEADSADLLQDDTTSVDDAPTEYYATFMITGALPDVLLAYDRESVGNGSYNIYITIETAQRLIEEGYPVTMGNEDLDQALVIYSES